MSATTTPPRPAKSVRPSQPASKVPSESAAPRKVIRRFLQHVLPSGFQKVRHYGFLSPNSSPSAEAVRWLITLSNGQLFLLLAQPQETPIWVPRLRCAECGGPLCLVGLTLPGDAWCFDTS